MAMFKVNGANVVKDPSSFDWGKHRISSGDAGRDQTGLMYVDTITEKRTIGLAWLGLRQSEVHAILAQFSADYFTITYIDPELSTTDTDYVTKTFYKGDASAPVKMWTDGKKLYSNLSFQIIER